MAAMATRAMLAITQCRTPPNSSIVPGKVRGLTGHSPPKTRKNPGSRNSYGCVPFDGWPNGSSASPCVSPDEMALGSRGAKMTMRSASISFRLGFSALIAFLSDGTLEAVSSSSSACVTDACRQSAPSAAHSAGQCFSRAFQVPLSRPLGGPLPPFR